MPMYVGLGIRVIGKGLSAFPFCAVYAMDTVYHATLKRVRPRHRTGGKRHRIRRRIRRLECQRGDVFVDFHLGENI